MQMGNDVLVSTVVIPGGHNRIVCCPLCGKKNLYTVARSTQYIKCMKCEKTLVKLKEKKHDE